MGMGLMGQAAAGFASGFGAGMVDSIKSEREHGEAMQRMGYANDLAMGREKELLRLKDEMEQMKQKRIAEVLGSVKRTEPMGPPDEAGNTGTRDIGDVEFARRRSDALSNAGLMDAAGREEERAMRYEDKAEGRRIREEGYKRDDATRRWQTEENNKMRAAMMGARAAGKDSGALSKLSDGDKIELQSAFRNIDQAEKRLNDITPDKFLGDKEGYAAEQKRLQSVVALNRQRANYLMGGLSESDIVNGLDEKEISDPKIRDAAVKQASAIHPRLGKSVQELFGQMDFESPIKQGEKKPSPAERSNAEPKEKGIFSEGGGMKEVPMGTIKKFIRGGLMGRGGVFGPAE